MSFPPTSLADLSELGRQPELQRATVALLQASHSTAEAEPLAGALSRVRSRLGEEGRAAALLAFWQSRTPGDPRGETRYRWELNHRIGVSIPTYAGAPTEWRAWRPGQQSRLDRDPFAFESYYLLPVILTENAEFLLELAQGGGEDAAPARALLAESAPIFRRDFARHVQMHEPSEDTFVLWCLVKHPRTLSLMHPIAVAIAACYAALGNGPILGLRHPYHDKPLVSASAQLATALLTLGSDLEFVALLADFVRQSRGPSGGWGDAHESEDVLTTLVSADLLSRVDPSFDPEPTVSFYMRVQGPDGLWRALGPDAPWLTLQILAWISAARRPFAERFLWPHRGRSIRDHKTGLPFFAYFAELAHLFGTLSGLAAQTVEIAFIDLVGFRAFNNRFGQAMGDDVLTVFARHLESLRHTRAIRDGGDEFLVVGAPTGRGLAEQMDLFRQAWPDNFHREFGADVPAVAPRILVGRAPGRDLRRAREALGRRITELKSVTPAEPAAGILSDVGDL